jgi:hypothetical protein
VFKFFNGPALGFVCAQENRVFRVSCKVALKITCMRIVMQAIKQGVNGLVLVPRLR